jgi:hypothetical protein
VPHDVLTAYTRSRISETARVLHRAADLIDHLGLAKGTLWDGDRLCTLQALWTGATGLMNANEVHHSAEFEKAACFVLDKLEDAGFGVYGARFSTICSWNNRDDLTQERVVYTLRLLAEVA